MFYHRAAGRGGGKRRIQAQQLRVLGWVRRALRSRRLQQRICRLACEEKGRQTNQLRYLNRRADQFVLWTRAYGTRHQGS